MPIGAKIRSSVLGLHLNTCPVFLILALKNAPHSTLHMNTPFTRPYLGASLRQSILLGRVRGEGVP